MERDYRFKQELKQTETFGMQKHRIKPSVANSLELNGIVQIKVSEVEKIIQTPL